MATANTQRRCKELDRTPVRDPKTELPYCEEANQAGHWQLKEEEYKTPKRQVTSTMSMTNAYPQMSTKTDTNRDYQGNQDRY